MMTLIALAIGVAFLFSAAVTLGYPSIPLWEAREIQNLRRNIATL